MKTITASDRSTLIRLASSLPVGDDTRKAILSGLRLADCGGKGYTSSDWDGVGKPGAGGLCNNIYHEYGSGISKNKKKYNEEYQSYVDGGNSGRGNCPGPAGNAKGVKCNR